MNVNARYISRLQENFFTLNFMRFNYQKLSNQPITTNIHASAKQTRNLCYSKDDRAMRAI